MPAERGFSESVLNERVKVEDAGFPTSVFIFPGVPLCGAVSPHSRGVSGALSRTGFLGLDTSDIWEKCPVQGAVLGSVPGLYP